MRLLTRSPWVKPIRLACVKLTTSVHPEPGSNSLLKPRFLLIRIAFINYYKHKTSNILNKKKLYYVLVMIS
jgi:hypothetical protein